MNPLFIAALSAVAPVRECPSCHAKQVIPRDKKEETVKCKYCGAEIPPPQKK